MANRHGVITGATGTGKTVTLQRMAEGFSQRGVPVFMADIKGDLTGVSQAGGGNPKIDDRNKQLGIEPQFRGFPVDAVGRFRQAGPSAAGDGVGNGAAADRADAAAE